MEPDAGCPGAGREATIISRKMHTHTHLAPFAMNEHIDFPTKRNEREHYDFAEAPLLQ